MVTIIDKTEADQVVAVTRRTLMAIEKIEKFSLQMIVVEALVVALLRSSLPEREWGQALSVFNKHVTDRLNDDPDEKKQTLQ